MFDFENLIVYKKAKQFNVDVLELLNRISLEFYVKDHLGRASLSVMLNIAEGTGRLTSKDKRHFLVISRGSVYECFALFDMLRGRGKISPELYSVFYSELEELSKMLFAMIQKLSTYSNKN